MMKKVKLTVTIVTFGAVLFTGCASKPETTTQVSTAVNQLTNQCSPGSTQLPDGSCTYLDPCRDALFDSAAGTQILARGSSTNMPTPNKADVEANRAAGVELNTRFVGTIKNIADDFGKQSHGQSGNSGYQGKLEGYAENFGQHVLNKLLKTKCYVPTYNNKNNSYGVYVVLYVPQEEAINKIVSDWEEMGIDVKAEQLKNKLEANLGIKKQQYLQIQQNLQQQQQQIQQQMQIP